MTEAEYKAYVLEDYDRKLKEDKLLPALVSPTPGGLKGVAADACDQRFMPKDEVLLRTFFKQKESPAAYRAAILKDDASVFKPLNNFLHKRSIKTQFRNIQLLAWLIDFEPRPFQPGLVRKEPASTPTAEAPQQEPRPASATAGPGGFTTESKGQSLGKNWSRAVVFILVMVVIVVAGFWLIGKKGTHEPTGTEGCMIWDNDHYQPVDCHDRTLQVSARKIDHKLVDHFQKILKPDTLTLHSISKVWYAKYNGRVEFFTAEGYHPLDSNKRLLPMTDYILEKYVYHMSN